MSRAGGARALSLTLKAGEDKGRNIQVCAILAVKKLAVQIMPESRSPGKLRVICWDRVIWDCFSHQSLPNVSIFFFLEEEGWEKACSNIREHDTGGDERRCRDRSGQGMSGSTLLRQHRLGCINPRIPHMHTRVQYNSSRDKSVCGTSAT